MADTPVTEKSIILHVEAERCEHGEWSWHNALRLPDGTTVADPDGECSGGRIRVGNREFGISMMLAQSLRTWTSDE